MTRTTRKTNVNSKNQNLDHHLREIVTKVGWKVSDPDSPFDTTTAAQIAIIGIAVWDSLAIEALRKLSEKKGITQQTIAVFDIDGCKTIRELNRVIPGASPVLQTPVVVQYQNGLLIRQVEGIAARKWMEECG